VSVLPAFWDEELEHLAKQVQGLYGIEMLDACIERATTFTVRAHTERPAEGDSLMAQAGIFCEALKDELWRRLLPH
jgi:hypothetical protein